MEHLPEVERQEIHDIYAAKGFKGKLLEEIVAHITSNDKLWLETMMREELGFAESPPKPGLNGIVMSVSFIVGALIPTIPYFLKIATFDLFYISSMLSLIGLFAAGAFKTKFTKKNIFFSAIETLAVGALAALGAYGIGVVIM